MLPSRGESSASIRAAVAASGRSMADIELAP
jgi:hypothetical protein